MRKLNSIARLSNDHGKLIHVNAVNADTKK